MVNPDLTIEIEQIIYNFKNEFRSIIFDTIADIKSYNIDAIFNNRFDITLLEYIRKYEDIDLTECIKKNSLDIVKLIQLLDENEVNISTFFNKFKQYFETEKLNIFLQSLEEYKSLLDIKKFKNIQEKFIKLINIYKDSNLRNKILTGHLIGNHLCGGGGMKDIIIPNILELLGNKAATRIQVTFRRHLKRKKKSTGGAPSKSGSHKYKINSQNIKLEYLKIINCDLNSKNFKASGIKYINNSNFINCSFSGATLDDIHFTEVTFTNNIYLKYEIKNISSISNIFGQITESTFKGNDFRIDNANIENAIFTKCKFIRINFGSDKKNTKLTRTIFNECTFINCSINSKTDTLSNKYTTTFKNCFFENFRIDNFDSLKFDNCKFVCNNNYTLTFIITSSFLISGS